VFGVEPVIAIGIMILAACRVVQLLTSSPTRQAISISIESGIQNGTLAIAIASITLQNSQLAIAGAIYSLIMFFTGFVAIWVGGIFSTKALHERKMIQSEKS